VSSKVFQGRIPTAIKNRWNVYLSKNIRSPHKFEDHKEISFNYVEFDFEDDFMFCLG
jgi:hypothetical protein